METRISSARKKGIYFDLDTNALKEKHPSGDYTKAYRDVRSFLEKNGFIHQQGSGYESLTPMTEIQVSFLVNKLKKTYPWLSGCVKKFVVTNVPRKYDYTDAFDPDGPSRENISVSNKQQTLKSINSIIKEATDKKNSLKDDFHKYATTHSITR